MQTTPILGFLSFFLVEALQNASIFACERHGPWATRPLSGVSLPRKSCCGRAMPRRLR